MGNWKENEIVEGEFSEDTLYRNSLTIRFNDILSRNMHKRVCVIGLNPSKADLKRDDPTIRKSLNWAYRKDYTEFCMLNAFSFRATLPKDMMATPDPIGKQSAADLACLCLGSAAVVAAWGIDGNYKLRANEIVVACERLGIQLHCFGTNKDGSPKHPCYIALNELSIYRHVTH